MGFEPTTFCLGSRYSTPELHPLPLRIGTTIYGVNIREDHEGLPYSVALDGQIGEVPYRQHFPGSLEMLDESPHVVGHTA